MLLRVGYFLRGFKQFIKTYIPAAAILFADSTNYKSDNTSITADNNSRMI